MLQSIRENIKGVGAWVIIIFLCVPFAFWGINQYFDTAAQNAAAVVNGEEISSFQVEQAYQQRYQQLLQAFGDELPADMINQQALRREQLNQLIIEELLRQKMQELGYRAGDEQVRQMLRQVPAFQENGRFSPELYRQALSMSGRSPAAFEALIRRDVALQQLQQGVNGTAFATPREAAMAVALEDQGRRHSAIVITDDAFAQAVEISEEDVQRYYEENAAQFLTEEKVGLAYIELTLDQYAQDIEVSDETLREIYASRADQYALQEQRQARHILIEGDSEAARAKAETALERIRGGEDFSAVAAEMSDDPVSAEEGGDLGLIQRGQLEGPFEEALFAMEAGEVSGPVQTDFGFHIIKLEDIKAPELQSFEDIKDQLARDYREQQAKDAFNDAVQRMADATFRDEGSLQSAAEELGVSVQTVEGVTRDSGDAIARNEAVRRAAFSESVLSEGINSDPIQLGPEQVVVVRAADHQPAEPKPLAEVEQEVREQLRTERAMAMAREKAESVLERARSGESLAEIAQSEGLVFRDESVTYRRTPDIGSGYAQALFSAPYPSDAPTYGMTAVENSDFVVFKLSAVIPGDYSGLTSSEKESRLRSVGQREAAAATAAYIAEMRNSADVVVREDNLEVE